MTRFRIVAVLALAAGMAAGSAGSGMSRGAATTPAGRGSATRAATVPSATAAALYTAIIQKYIAAEWDTMGEVLGKARDIAAMSREQQADVTYIRQAVNDGRPAWWNQVKLGRKVSISTRLWTRSISAVWDPSLNPGSVTMQQGGGQTSFTTSWLAADMDSTAQAEHGFTKGDLAYVNIWSELEMMEVYAGLSLVRVSTLDQAQQVKLNRFMGFRGMVTAGYFGTPRARRWAGFLSLDAYLGDHVTSEAFIARKPFGAMLVQEIVSHPAKYPSLRVPRNVAADKAESTLATNFMNQFQRTTLPYAEDKALREAIKAFALANGTAIYEGGKVILPNKLVMPINPDDDTETAKLRNTWLMEEIAEPGVHAAAASKPATTRAGSRP